MAVNLASNQPSATETRRDPTLPLDPTDEMLLVAIRAGDDAALGTLYDRYGRLAFGVAYRVLEERGAAEDAVQDAFLAVWQRAASYHQERGSVRGWLLTIARNAAIDRRRGRHAWALSDTPLDDVAFRLTTEAEDPFATAVAAVDAEQVRQALAALPSEQRQVIELAYDGGLTHHEIADRVGIPLGTVKGRVRLGLQRLRQLLSPPPGADAARSDRQAVGEESNPEVTPRALARDISGTARPIRAGSLRFAAIG